MNRNLFLLTLLLFLCTYSLFGQKPMEDDPYLLWQTTDPLGYSGFVIHPNGNIIANRNCEFFEVDGNTGEQIRVFPVHYGYSEAYSVTISPDGKYFAAIYWGADSGTTFIFDYQTGEVFRKFKRIGDNIRFFPDSKRILLTTFLQGTEDKSLEIYDIENESFKYFGAGIKTEGYECLNISDDGKYFATGGRIVETNGLGEKFYYTRLRLWDALTLKPIKELANIGGDFEVKSIKFSPDGKYVGFHVGWHDFYIYSCDDFNLVRLYNQLNVEFPPLTFTFLNSNMISFTSLQLNERERFISIQSIDNDIVRYRYLGKTGFGTPAYSFLKFNSFNNSLVLNGGHLFAFDLNKILNSVRVDETIEPQTKFQTEYRKGILSIKNYESKSNSIIITINDFQGKVVFSQQILSPNSQIEIPLDLMNGVYILQIQDGKQSYSKKFLVIE